MKSSLICHKTVFEIFLQIYEYNRKIKWHITTIILICYQIYMCSLFLFFLSSSISQANRFSKRVFTKNYRNHYYHLFVKLENIRYFRMRFKIKKSLSYFKKQRTSTGCVLRLIILFCAPFCHFLSLVTLCLMLEW